MIVLIMPVWVKIWITAFLLALIGIAVAVVKITRDDWHGTFLGDDDDDEIDPRL